MTGLLDRLRETFGQESVTLLEHRPGTPLTPARQRDPGTWQVVATVAASSAQPPTKATPTFPLARTSRSCCAAGPCPPPTGASWKPSPPRRRLRCASGWPAEAERTRPLAEADQMRTAPLSAVSHDLRTPLSSAMVAVESLASPDITWTDERTELVATG